MKKYQLSDDEKAQGQGRIQVRQMVLYLTRLVEEDIDAYVEGAIKKRLGLSREDDPRIDWGTGELTVEEKVIKPTSADVEAIARGVNKGNHKS